MAGHRRRGVCRVTDVVASDGVVTLRHWHESDADAIVEACQDPEIHYWIPLIPRPYTRDDALAYIRGELETVGQHQHAIVVDERVVGSIGMGVNRNRTGHVGYWCAREARGSGLTTRALRLLSRYAFDELGLQR